MRPYRFAEKSPAALRQEILDARGADYFTAAGISTLLDEFCRRLAADTRRVNRLNARPRDAELRQRHQEQRTELLMLAGALHLMPGDERKPPPKLQ